MKQGWQQKELREIAQVGAGNSAPQKSEFFTNGTYPFFRTSDIGKIRFGTALQPKDYLNNNGIKKLRKFPQGTILFPKSGASTFLNHRVILGIDAYVSSHLATIIGDETKVVRKFLLYFLTTISAQDLIQDHSYPSLNLSVIAQIPVSLPSTKEQKRIVALLDNAFEAIDISIANTKKDLQNARELFESYLNEVFSKEKKGWIGKRKV